jgi:5-formyltetrahydrofolate cyclo-ligase
MVKSVLRREYLQKRLDLDEDFLELSTRKIKTIFKQLSVPPVEVFLSYYPITARNEFDVTVCDQVILEKFPRANLAWPKTDPENASMEAHILEEHGLFAKNKFNILEPIGNNVVTPASIDLVFVPLLACDTKGFRVGYGKGYYDRFLKRCRKNIVKIGFSFFEPLDTIEDINEFDVPLSYCITPSRLYEF